MLLVQSFRNIFIISRIDTLWSGQNYTIITHTGPVCIIDYQRTRISYIRSLMWATSQLIVTDQNAIAIYSMAMTNNLLLEFSITITLNKPILQKLKCSI